MLRIQDKNIYINDKVIGKINHYSLIKEDSFSFFVDKNGFSKDEFKNIIKIIPQKFMALDYIEIDEDQKNKGYGTQAVLEMIRSTNLDVILIPNMDSEFIIDWYLGLGFEEISVSAFLPILIFRK